MTYNPFVLPGSGRVNTLTSTVVIWVHIKHPVPDRVKKSFVIFDIRAHC